MTFKCTNCSATKFQDDLTIRERICKKCGMASPIPEEVGEGCSLDSFVKYIVE